MKAATPFGMAEVVTPNQTTVGTSQPTGTGDGGHMLYTGRSTADGGDGGHMLYTGRSTADGGDGGPKLF